IMLEETEEIANLPELEGKGNQYSLHQAMLLDETGTLKDMVEQYVAEEDEYKRKKMLPQIIFQWTGVADKDAYGRGGYLSDARKLEALEVIIGRKFTSAYGANPVEGAADYIEEAFDKLVELYYTQLEMQTVYADMYSVVLQNTDVNEDGNIIFKADGFGEYMSSIVGVDSDKKIRLIVGFIDNLKSNRMFERVDSDALREEIGKMGAEYLYVYDHMGNETINGTDGDDVINGCSGDDVLKGENGNDTYIFNIGDGKDVIKDDGGIDRIVFGNGIRPEDIRVLRSSRDLYLNNIITGDQIRIENYHSGNANLIESIEFSDGTVWIIKPSFSDESDYFGTEISDMISAKERVVGLFSSSEGESGGGSSVVILPSNDFMFGFAGNDTMYGNRGDDYLYGGIGHDSLYGGEDNDYLYGEEGNDSLYGELGDDILAGGKGKDSLSGGKGNDTYVFELGDGRDVIHEEKGTDTILFGSGISTEDIVISRDAYSLYLTNKTNGDRIHVDMFYSDKKNEIENIRTIDGYELDMKKLDLIIQTMASFEDTDGMSWQDAVAQKNERAVELMNQWWIKKAV
ncbi:MAG: hypothetical protein K6G76_09585, partial [Lachnospiraceae bacterium]|nr:hypothetical protein [Lachnospiraceae bacterium]